MSLAARQAEMRQRYLPEIERRRGRRGQVAIQPTAAAAPVRKKHKSEECQIGYHFLDCPDLNCACSCHVADGEYKGEPTQ